MHFELHSSADTVFVVPAAFIVPATLNVTLDSTVALHRDQDYRFDPAMRSIVLSNALTTLLWSSTTSLAHTLLVSYTAIPLALDRTYALYKLENATLADSLSDTLTHARRVTAAASTSEGFVGSLQRSGSISRGFQVGSNRDLALTSGFNLQFSGLLAEDVSLTGALSEESTPIQPEGTTQALQDVDRIFITVKAGEHFGATLGDFYTFLNTPDPSEHFRAHAPLGISTGRSNPFVGFSASTFDALTRKVLGAEAKLHYGQADLSLVGASARGQHTTNTFQGQESFQGPYRLTGKTGERAIIVIAGTERVYVDGELKTRGERNDYIIDYSIGEVRFEPGRLITSNSRIVIDFEYSDQQYSRTLIAATGTGRLFDDHLQLRASYFREGDDPNAPLDASISDTDRSILARAGNNRLAATRSGVVLAGRDKNGRALGSYLRKDTIIDAVASTIYVYAPLDTVNSVYNVVFGFAGANRGSYVRQGIGQYSFAGAGRGDYDTLRFLPLPQLDQIVAVHGLGSITSNLAVTGEFAMSNFDENRLAPIASVRDAAYRVGAMFADTLPVLGYAEFRATHRYVGNAFRPLDRTQDVEFFRRYGDDASSAQVGETIEEATLLYRPLSKLQFNASYGLLNRPTLGFRSDRAFVKAEVFEDSLWLPHVTASFEYIPITDSARAEKAEWKRSFAELSRLFSSQSMKWTIGSRAGYEEKLSRGINAPFDSATALSFSYLSYGPFANVRLVDWLNLTGEVTWRTDDSVRNGMLTPFSRAATERATLTLGSLAGFSGNFDLTLRDKRFVDTAARRLGGGDQATKLLRFEPRYQRSGLNAELLYEISDQRSARLERVFLPVQPGYGTYKYLGDLNHNGKPDANEFEIARYANEATYILVTIPTEQLFPVTDLRTSARLHVIPRDLLGVTDSSTLTMQVIGAISSESFVRLSETSRDENPSNIYFLRLSHFLNPQTTVKGSYDFEQNFNILEPNPLHSYRLHFLERRNAGQFNTGLERTYSAERSLRVRLRPGYEWLGETIAQSGTDLAESDSLSLNRPHSTSTISGSTDWTYHPTGSALDYALRLEASRAQERSVTPAVRAFTNAITGRTSYALESRSRIRAEIERDELTLSDLPAMPFQLPYALTGGRSVGITWLWRLSLDYQFASGFVATLGYDGRNDNAPGGDRQTVHNARAEVRASF